MAETLAWKLPCRWMTTISVTSAESSPVSAGRVAEKTFMHRCGKGRLNCTQFYGRKVLKPAEENSRWTFLQLVLDALTSRLAGGGTGSGRGVPPVRSSHGDSGKGVVPPDKITRKRRDPSELINRSDSKATGPSGGIHPPPREPNPLEYASKRFEEEEAIVLRKIFKLGPSDLLVIVKTSKGGLNVRLATNLQQGPLKLHWAISRNNEKEWLTPPEEFVPEGTVLSNGFAETPFTEGFAGDVSFKSVEINLRDSDCIGMPFLCKVGEDWWKDNGEDYYVALKAADIQKRKVLGSGHGTAREFLEDIATQETEAERSLMHRYNIATGFASRVKDEGELALVGLLVWLRYMATRQLTWNKNYNVKPQEISAAQEKLTDVLRSIYRDQPQSRDVVRLIMSTVGRGAQGDVGQRIRDEILVLQRNNNCKGGMMEEWHQKLHNNTSPDDVVICQALIDFIQNDFNMAVYWKTLNDHGITKERMKSYDRPIVSEPNLRRGEKDTLIRDLTAYLNKNIRKLISFHDPYSQTRVPFAPGSHWPNIRFFRLKCKVLLSRIFARSPTVGSRVITGIDKGLTCVLSLARGLRRGIESGAEETSSFNLLLELSASLLLGWISVAHEHARAGCEYNWASTCRPEQIVHPFDVRVM